MKLAFITILFCQFIFAQFEAKILESTMSKVSTADGRSIQLEKGRIQVPNNRKNPTYSIVLPYYKIHSLSKAPKDPIFFLAGGPGDSGLPHPESFWVTYAESFLDYSDVIFFDQRGTGKSEPNLHLDGSLDIPVELAMEDPEFWIFFFSQMSKRIKNRAEDQNINLNDFNTFENANDIDDIRKLLGYSKISLWGHSYGSHLGYAYINQFEEHASKAMFTGINGINDRYRLPSESDAVIDRMNSYIQEDAYYRNIFPDFAKTVRELIKDFRDKPKMVNISYRTAYNFNNKSFWEQVSLKAASLFTDSIQVKIGEYEFKTFLMMTFQGSNNLYNVPLAILRIKNGDYKALAIMVKQFISQGGKNSPVTRNGMTYTMAISSHSSFEKLKAVKAEMEKNESFLSGVLNIPFIYQPLHEKLNMQYLPDSFREERTYSLPILLLNGDLDSRTTLAHVERNAKLFPNSTVFVVQKASHTFYGLDPRIMEVMTDFVADQPLRYSSIKINRKFYNPLEPIHRQKLTQLFNDNKIEEFKSYAHLNKKNIHEFTLNGIGYSYMTTEEFEKALVVFKINLDLFPDSSNAFDSIGEAYFNLKKYDLSLENYTKSVSKNKLNRNGYNFIKQIKTITRNSKETL